LEQVRVKPFIEMIYLQELLAQANAGIRAVRSLQASASSDADAVHDHAADFLNHAAVISKILKPSNADGKGVERVRGRYLRGKLGLADDHPVLDRKLRDLLEHIDEKLDRWAAEAEGQGYLFVDKNIGGTMINAPGRDPHKYTLRDFDPVTAIYTVQGESFDLKEKVQAVVEVRDLALKRLAAVNVLRAKE
jgi:hypothetical protein